MKKLLALLLAVMIGLMLAACSGESGGKTEPLTELEMKVVGEWKLAPESANGIVIRDDRTMSIDGVEYTWQSRVEVTYGINAIVVDAYLDDAVKYSMIFASQNDLAMSRLIDASTGNFTNGTYYLKEDFDNLPDVYGEWKATPEAKSGIVIKKDGTVLIDGTEYTWSGNFNNGSGYDSLNVTLNGEKKYSIAFKETEGIMLAYINDANTLKKTLPDYFREEAFASLPDYSGEWYPKYSSYGDDAIDYSKPYLTINKEGTLTIENETYDYYYDSWNSAEIGIHLSKDGAYVGVLHMENYDGDEYLRISISGKNLAITNFVSSPDCERIEITNDNWQDYFALQPQASVRKNAFDEVERVSVDFEVSLKPEFSARALKCDVAVEYSYDTFGFDRGRVEYDIETGEIKVEVTAEGHGMDDIYIKQYGTRTENDTRKIGLGSGININPNWCVGSLTVESGSKIAKDEEVCIPRDDGWSINRIQGYIILDK